MCVIKPAPNVIKGAEIPRVCYLTLLRDGCNCLEEILGFRGFHAREIAFTWGLVGHLPGSLSGLLGFTGGVTSWDSAVISAVSEKHLPPSPSAPEPL